MSILIFFIILLVLVLIHEFGHFYSAKKFGIRVDEFGFGFPPKVFGIKKGETEYTFNLLPIGGFVKIFGENPDDDSMSGPDSSRSFVNKPRWQQAIVLFAGVFANFVLAWVLLSFGFLSGMPTSVGSADSEKYNIENVQLVIVATSPGSPAEKAGLLPGDAIVSLGEGEELTEEITPETVKTFISGNGGQEVKVGYTRGDNEVKYAYVTPPKTEGTPMIGISMDMVGVAKLPFFTAFKEGMILTLKVTKATALGLYNLIADALKGNGSMEAVTGPVGMVAIVGDAYDLGLTYLLSFAAIISLNLAIINLLPFPALDGGRLFFLLIEKIKGSRIKPEVANMANMVGFFILITFMLVVTIRDVSKLF